METTKTIKSNIEEIKEILKSSFGTILNVVFIKKDNSLRSLTGRLGVKSHLRGGVSTTAHIPKYITIFDFGVNQYRNINCETIQSMKIKGVEYIVE